MEQNKNTFQTIIISAITSVIVFALCITLYTGVSKISLKNSQTSTSTSQLIEKDVSVVGAVKKANPAVVSIIVTKDLPIYEQRRMSSPFDFFFNTPQYEQKGTKKTEVGGGSGFLVSQDGMIVTNNHVVDDENAEYTVYTNDGKKHDTKVIAHDSVLDIAVLKIQGTGYSYLQFGSSKDLELGQSVIAIGNALAEYRNTVSVGVVSGLSRSIVAGSAGGNSEQLDELIQTDAAINPGNSGGPLLNLSGEVVGMNVAVAAGSQNIGFALPGDNVKAAVESVKTTGSITYPYVGIRYIPIDASVQEQNKLSVDYGVLISKGPTASEPAVVPNSPGAKAGLVEGDIILEFNGTKLTTDIRLASLIRAKKAGDTVTLKILHGKQEKVITLKLEEHKE